MEDAGRDIGVQYGNITVRILREFYGSFAPHCADSEKLGDAIPKLDEASLTQIFETTKVGSCGSSVGMSRCLHRDANQKKA